MRKYFAAIGVCIICGKPTRDRYDLLCGSWACADAFYLPRPKPISTGGPSGWRFGGPLELDLDEAKQHKDRD
jgi:hypothetical protein